MYEELICKVFRNCMYEVLAYKFLGTVCMKYWQCVKHQLLFTLV